MRIKGKTKIKKPKTIKNRSALKIAIIAGVVVLGLVVPQIVWASFLDKIARDILIGLMSVIHHFLNWLIGAAGTVFDRMLKIGFEKNLEVIKNGWGVTRDFANMFFILFMVVIAFATILRTEQFQQYGIKQLLPKVIIIALLINFSYVISAVIIDFSNVTANFFITDIDKKIQGKGGVGATFADSLSITGVYLVYTDCVSFEQKYISECKRLNQSRSLFKLKRKYNCNDLAQMLRTKCEKQGQITIQREIDDVNFLNLILSLIVGSIVMLMAAFTLFAGAILLLIRIIAIWLLVTIVPLAFLCYIMPGLRNNWQKWWSNFLKWCFFAPAYAFFVWMAITIATNYANRILAKTGTGAVNDFTSDWGPLSNEFVANPGEQIIGYGIIIAFLLGGLIMAQKLGIYGASTAMAIGQKWGKGARRWVAQKTTRYPKELGAALGGAALGGVGKTLKQIPGLGKFGRGLEARGTMLRRKPEEAKGVKDYEKRAKLMSDKDLLADVKAQIGVLGLAATKIASERGLLQKSTDRNAVRTGINTLRGYGYIKEADELEEKRFSVITDAPRRKEIAKKARVKGIHKEWRAPVFEGKPGQEAAADVVANEPTISAVVQMANEMRLDARKQFAEALYPKFINNINFDITTETGRENIKQRSAFATVTGKLHVAFTNTSTGRVEEPALKDFVTKMKPQNFADISPESIKYIAPHIDASAAVEAGRYLSAEMKREFAKTFNTMSNTFKDVLKRAPGWASFIT